MYRLCSVPSTCFLLTRYLPVAHMVFTQDLVFTLYQQYLILGLYVPVFTGYIPDGYLSRLGYRISSFYFKKTKHLSKYPTMTDMVQLNKQLHYMLSTMYVTVLTRLSSTKNGDVHDFH